MISNSTPIISLAKVGKLELLEKLFGTVTLPRAVEQEVLVEGKPGYVAIAEAFRQGWLKAAQPQNILNLGLGKGEEAAISLARETNDTLIMDDAFAIKAAKALGLNSFRTTTVVIAAVAKKIITRKGAVAIIKDLVNAGYYITPKHLAELLTRLT